MAAAIGPTAKLGGAQADRFSERTVGKWYWLDKSGVAGAEATLTELQAATDLTPAIAGDVSGFDESSNTVDTPDLANVRVGKILDYISVNDGSIPFYGSRTGSADDASSFFTPEQQGYLYHLPYGDATGQTMDKFTAQIGSVSPSTTISGAKQVTVAFIVNAVERNLAIPTV